MPIGFEQRRVLVITGERKKIGPVFAIDAFSEWEVIYADSSAAAALVLQSNPCDILVADESHYRREGIEGISWLIEKETTPMVFLADVNPEIIGAAYDRGISLWLPQRQTLQYPALLAGALERALHWNDLQRRHRRARESLDQSQRQVDRLVSLMWRTAPMTVEKRWYTHRHMLERLEEEIARAARYHLPFTMAIGEIELEPGDPHNPKTVEMLHWTANEVASRKRTSDVAGQYGFNGFMLLLAHTPSQGAVRCCQRLQEHLEEGAQEKTGPREQLKAFFGLASYSGKASTAQRLLRCAEEHLETAKQDPIQRVVAG